MAGGVLTDKALRGLVASGGIAVGKGGQALHVPQIQPASMDLQLGPVAYRVQATMLPGPDGKVLERIKPMIMSELDLTKPQMLERGAIYVIPLLESMKLPEDVMGTCSPKSSTGRLDIFVRVVADGASIYDTLAPGYAGGLYLEVMPLTFPIVVRMGDRLSQLRLRRGNCLLNDEELVREHGLSPLAYEGEGMFENRLEIAEGLWTTIDLHGEGEASTIVGYKAKHHTQPVDLARVGGYAWRDFWEPIRRHDCQPLILYPGEFYILVSAERLSVPAHLSAELVAYDIRVGELRLHYAGFFDPGWGYSNGVNHGTRAVLEVRAHDVACVLEHGQRVGRFIYERLGEAPEQLYGAGIGSNYAGQKLKLAKQFRME